jgi:hypothetical protein
MRANQTMFAAIAPVGAAALGLAVSGMGAGIVQVAGKPRAAPGPPPRLPGPRLAGLNKLDVCRDQC